MVGPTFGDERQGWNKAYSVCFCLVFCFCFYFCFFNHDSILQAAQTIYSKGPKSMAVRAGIKSQHTAIYRKVCFCFCFRFSFLLFFLCPPQRDTDQTGNIFCGDSFFGLLHWGFRRFFSPPSPIFFSPANPSPGVNRDILHML